MTRISLITATYNCVDTIDDCLTSVGQQEHDEVEHIVIDGASTDGTLEAIRRHPACPQLVVSERDGGIYDALNKGVRHATGDVVGFLHGDDRFADNKVLSDVASAFLDQDVFGVYADIVLVDRHDTSKILRYWRAEPFSRDRLSAGWVPPHPTLYLRRSVYQDVGEFDTSFRISADYDFMMRALATSRSSLQYIPRVTVCMRVGGASTRLTSIPQKVIEDLRAIRNNGYGGVGTLLAKTTRKLTQVWRRPTNRP